MDEKKDNVMKEYKISFQCPLNGVPCVAIYDVEGSVLYFMLENDDVLSQYAENEINEANEWCMYNASNCDSIHFANRHLLYLGVNDLFIPDDDVIYVSRKFDL